MKFLASFYSDSYLVLIQKLISSIIVYFMAFFYDFTLYFSESMSGYCFLLFFVDLLIIKVVV